MKYLTKKNEHRAVLLISMAIFLICFIIHLLFYFINPNVLIGWNDTIENFRYAAGGIEFIYSLIVFATPLIFTIVLFKTKDKSSSLIMAILIGIAGFFSIVVAFLIIPPILNANVNGHLQPQQPLPIMYLYITLFFLNAIVCIISCIFNILSFAKHELAVKKLKSKSYSLLRASIIIGNVATLIYVSVTLVFSLNMYNHQGKIIIFISLALYALFVFGSNLVLSKLISAHKIKKSKGIYLIVWLIFSCIAIFLNVAIFVYSLYEAPNVDNIYMPIMFVTNILAVLAFDYQKLSLKENTSN